MLFVFNPRLLAVFSYFALPNAKKDQLLPKSDIVLSKTMGWISWLLSTKLDLMDDLKEGFRNIFLKVGNMSSNGEWFFFPDGERLPQIKSVFFEGSLCVCVCVGGCVGENLEKGSHRFQFREGNHRIQSCILYLYWVGTLVHLLWLTVAIHVALSLPLLWQ